MKLSLGVNGACGRMGLRIIDLASADKDIVVMAALESPTHPMLGCDIGEIAGIGSKGLNVTSELPQDMNLDAIIDFSHAEGTMAILAECVTRRVPVVVATTGHTPDQRKKIEAATHEIAMLMAPNMSLAVNVLMVLVRRATELLRDQDFDVEIIERHHRFKKDAPSGTALHLAKIVQGAMGAMPLRHGREGQVGERPVKEIGVHAVRVGDNVGEHTIVLSTLGETLELTHRAHARDCYARGAIQAAKYLVGRSPGMYTMEDVLGISE